MDSQREKHKTAYPNLREIRRTCNRELYRTIKKLKIWIAPDQIESAEQYYLKKVLNHLPWIVENKENRQKLTDWWEENVCPEIARMWNVNPSVLAAAFRKAFGG